MIEKTWEIGGVVLRLLIWWLACFWRRKE